MTTYDDQFWAEFHAKWPDMTLVNGLIHAGDSSDATLHEAMTALREGRVPDIDPERTHERPARAATRWVPSGIGTNQGGMIIRREEEPEEEPED
jgi:hypothetical protein